VANLVIAVGNVVVVPLHKDHPATRWLSPLPPEERPEVALRQQQHRSILTYSSALFSLAPWIHGFIVSHSEARCFMADGRFGDAYDDPEQGEEGSEATTGPLTRRDFFSLSARGLAGASLAPGLFAAYGGSSLSAAAQTLLEAAIPSPNTSEWPKIRSKEVILAGFGGQTYTIRHQQQFGPFTKKSGAKVIDAPWDYGKFVAMLKSKHPEWDAIDFDGFSAVGLLQGGYKLGKLAPWVRRCDLVDPAYRDYCAGGYGYAVVLGYSKSLPATPNNWADFFDTQRFPGKRALPKGLYPGIVELALLADGVPRDKVQPVDFDRGFKKLDTIKSDVLFFDSNAQAQQYLVQGSASMAATANNRMQQLKDQNAPVDYIWQDAIFFPWSGFVMPPNLPHRDATNALIDWLSAPSEQAFVARTLRLSPTVSKAFKQLSTAEKALLPNSPANRVRVYSLNTAKAAKQDAEYAKRYTAWVSS
jgi:putative spermidine/putrescine transport system substrate-binding protein